MTRFEVLRAVTGVKEFSGLIVDILKEKETSEAITEFLTEELTEKQLQTVKSVAESGNYPLSLEGLQ